MRVGWELSRKGMRKLCEMLVINLYLQMLELQRYLKESSLKIWVFHSMYILPKRKILNKYWTLVNEFMMCMLKYLGRNILASAIYLKCFKK